MLRKNSLFLHHCPWFGDQILLEPLVQALSDDYPAVCEDLLDAFGKAPLRAPVEPVIAALTDPVHYVWYVALETLGLMGERVPPSVYPVLQEMSGADSGLVAGRNRKSEEQRGRMGHMASQSAS